MKPEKMTLNKQDVINLNNGINAISALNRESAFPIYDMGFRAAACMARTFKALKPAIEQVQEELKKHDEERDAVVKERDGLEEKARKEREKEFEDRLDECRKKRRKWLDEEELEVTVYRFQWKDVPFNKGQTPTAEILMFLAPIIIWPPDKDETS